ncbi:MULTISPECIES: hypothetical protein [Bacillaceae]|nr:MULTISPECIES: hypothetical protein [Bacillaceae]
MGEQDTGPYNGDINNQKFVEKDTLTFDVNPDLVNSKGKKII